MSFAAEVAQFNKKAMAQAEKDRRAIILKLFTAVIRDTPVDTGRARNNWLTSVGAPVFGTPNAPNKSGADAMAGATGNLGKLTDTTYLTNNVEYIGHLEYGTPKMAPFAMVRRNMARIVSLLGR
jgi:hypothetical protein